MTQQNPAFRTVMRGYDPNEVERTLGDLRKALEAARAEAADGSVAATKLNSQVAQLTEQANSYRARMAALEQEQKESTPVLHRAGLADRQDAGWPRTRPPIRAKARGM